MKKIAIVIVVVLAAVAGRLVFLSQNTTEPEHVPVITVVDILNASDLTEGIKRAVATDNETAIDEWLSKAIDVAVAAELSDDDIQWLNSVQARDYVVFNAKRELFNETFETRYLALESIDDLAQKYPEAGDLFEKAQVLIKKRDEIIYAIAQTLAQGDKPTSQHIEEAKAIWRERYRSEQASTHPQGS